jgi:hypothetical protein
LFLAIVLVFLLESNNDSFQKELSFKEIKDNTLSIIITFSPYYAHSCFFILIFIEQEKFHWVI